MKQILTIISILTSIIFCPSISASELIMPNGDFSKLRKTGIAKVTEVVNPLTVKLEDGSFIHLAGLDFPDLDYYDPGDLSVTAQEILDDFLKNKKVIIYQTSNAKKGHVNRMNHRIAHLVRTDNDVWVQGILLSLGLARVRTTQYNPEMAEQMLFLEKTARQDRLGLWDMNEFKILPPDNTEKYIGSYQIVEGHIRSASMRKNKLYLNFGNNWRDDFTVAISTFDLRKFTKQRIEPQKWNGRLIRVRGWIESYNGPYMAIDHPERFEALFENLTDTMEANNAVIPDTPAARPQKKEPPRKKDKGSALPVLND